MKTTNSFDDDMDRCRYTYDNGECSISNGFAQVDTRQDASYYGTWANPRTFTIVCYCEGDVSRQVAENAEEFVAAMRELKRWACGDDTPGATGLGWAKSRFGIDPGFDEPLKQAFEEIGLGDLLH